MAVVLCALLTILPAVRSGSSNVVRRAQIQPDGRVANHLQRQDIQVPPSDAPRHTLYSKTSFEDHFAVAGDEYTESKRFFVFHTRKAGGTTVRRFIDSVCSNKFDTAECAWVLEGGSVNDWVYQHAFGHTSRIKYSIINFREPVSRVQSLIGSNLRVWRQKCQENRSRCVAQPTMQSEIDRLSNCHSAPADVKCGIPMWGCGVNMYVKSLVGTNPTDPSGSWQTVSDDDLRTAQERLKNFNIVMITEWFDDADVQEYVHKHVLGMPNVIKVGGQYTSNRWTFEGDRYDMNDGERAHVATLNTYDSKLYASARSLLVHRMNEAGFKVTEALLDSRARATHE